MNMLSNMFMCVDAWPVETHGRASLQSRSLAQKNRPGNEFRDGFHINVGKEAI